MFEQIINTNFYNISSTLFFIVLAWSLVWKGLALWKAARSSEKYWYIAMLVINTMGVLEILYIFVFAKKKGIKDL